MIGGEFLLSGCKAPTGKDIGFSKTDLSLLNEIGETIIPATDTPGAKAANVAKVMEVVVRDCYWPEHQKAFMEGIKQIDVESNKDFGKDFMSVTAELRKEQNSSINWKKWPRNLTKKWIKRMSRREKKWKKRTKASTSSARLNIITR